MTTPSAPPSQTSAPGIILDGQAETEAYQLLHTVGVTPRPDVWEMTRQWGTSRCGLGGRSYAYRYLLDVAQLLWEANKPPDIRVGGALVGGIDLPGGTPVDLD